MLIAAARWKCINDVCTLRREEKKGNGEKGAKKTRGGRKKGRRECVRYRRVNRPSRRCLIRYLGAAKSLLIYPRINGAYAGITTSDRDGKEREEARDGERKLEALPNGTSPKAGLTRNKSRRFINLTSLTWCLWHSRPATSSSVDWRPVYRCPRRPCDRDRNELLYWSVF